MIRSIPGGRDTAGLGGSPVRADQFADMIVEHVPRLRRYAVALVGDPSFADDLVQDTLERALRRRETLLDQRTVYPWMRSILHNIQIDRYRQRRARGTAVAIDGVADTLALSVAPAERTAAFDLVRAMNRLSVDHRQILLLVGLEGLSYREIAAELAVPIGTVMSRIARARAQLRIEMDGLGGRDDTRAAPRRLHEV